MNHTIIYIVLDVDDTQYHGLALDKHTCEVIDFKCRPILKGLLSRLERLDQHFPGRTLKCATRLPTPALPRSEI